MGHITRNANVILLFMILIAATALVGATIYFQSRFTAINDEYNDKLTQLRNVSVQLEQYQDVLSTAKEELTLKGTREEDLTNKYTTIKGEKDTLTSERNKLLSDKTSLEIALASRTTELTTTKNQVLNDQAVINGLRTDIGTLQTQNANLKNTIDDLKDEVDCLEDTPDAQEASC
jgi:chromosome segregation ATPase